MAEFNVVDENKAPVEQGEMLRYQNNKSCYWLGMLAVVCSLVYIFVLLNRFSQVGYTGILFFKIIANILLFLSGFLCCEKMKAYDIKWGYVAIAFGGIAIVRAFIFPMFVMSGKVITDVANPGMAILLMALMFATAALFIYAGIVTIKKSKILNDYLNSINEPRNI